MDYSDLQNSMTKDQRRPYAKQSLWLSKVMLFTVCLCFFTAAATHAQNWRQLGSNINGESTGDASGYSVAYSADGTIAAIGATGNNGGGADAGQVRVYKYDGSDWSQIGGDIDGESARDESGYSISISSDGTVIAIGAPANDDGGSSAGQVRVYKYDGTDWSQIGGDMDGESAEDESGYAVSLSSDGTIVAIGAPQNDDSGSNAGHVRIYEYDGSNWSQIGSDIDGEASDDGSGQAVSLSSDGSILAIGATGNSGSAFFAGHVRVYEYSGGSWSQIGSDIDGEAAFDFSGYAVSLSSDGDRLAIGATGSDGSGFDAGHARVYEYDGSDWSQIGDDIDGEAAVDRSGHSISMSSDGNRVAIGSYLNDGNGDGAGHARLYRYESGNWDKLGADLNGEAVDDAAGYAIALSADGTRLIVGATGNDDGGSNAGHVKIYEVSSPEPSEYPTDFAATTISSSELMVTWTDASGSQLPRGYLLMTNITGVFIDPVDAVEQPDDTDLSDGEGVVNVLHGVGEYDLTGLDDSTQYFFKIFPYTNSGPDIDYKADADAPVTDTSTLADLYIECPRNVNTSTDLGDDSATVLTLVPFFVNNVGDSSTVVNSYTMTNNASGRYPLGLTNVEYTLTDYVSSQTETCIQRVRITDNEKPVLFLPNDTTVSIPTSSGIFTYDVYATDNAGFSGSLSADPLTIVPLNSFICGGGGVHTANSYVKVIDLKQDIDIRRVEFGVQSATPGAGYSKQPVIVKLYALDSADSVKFDNLILLDSTYLELMEMEDEVVQAPVTGSVTAGQKIVVEVFTPDAFTTGLFHSFFIGADTVSGSECYWAAETCSYSDLVSPDVVLSDVFWDIDAIADVDDTVMVVGSGDLELVSGRGSGAVFPKGTHIEQYKATDSYGNVIEGEFTVTILSSEPVANCTDTTIYLDASGDAQLSLSDFAGTSTDDEGIVSYTLSDSVFDCTDIAAVDGVEVELIVEDTDGQFDTCVSIIMVRDTLPPSVSCRDMTVYLTDTGSVSITAADVDAGSSDNCSVSLSIDQNTFSCVDNSGMYIGHTDTNTVILTAIDPYGNTSSCEATIVVLDTTSPTAIAGDTTLYLDASGAALVDAADLDRGSMDNCGAIDTVFLTQTAFACADLGTNTITFSAKDASGNEDETVVEITVLDTIPPLASAHDTTIYLDASGAASVSAASVDAGSSDNCGIDTYLLDKTSFNCSDIGTHQVWFYVLDASGNKDSAQATVHVQDTLSPTVLGSNITLSLDASGQASTTPDEVDNGSSDNCGIDSIYLSSQSFACSDIGVNPVWLYARDTTGNLDSVSIDVTVEDAMSPLINAADTTLYLDALGEAILTAASLDNGSTDNCAVDSVGISQTAFSCADAGANTLTFTATDPSGNSSTINLTVTVLDTTSPAPMASDTTLYLDASGSASISATDLDNGSSDNCSVATISISQTAFDCGHIGDNALTFTATDPSGNEKTTIVNVTVLDTTSPAPVAHDTTLYLDASGSVSVTADDINDGSTDNCAIASISISQGTFDCDETGDHTITLTATDASGNVATATATVTVLDTTSPAPMASDTTIYLDASGSASLSATDLDDGSSDNCSVASISISQTAFDCGHTGDNMLTFTATDPSGNVATTSVTVTVLDTTSPTPIAHDTTLYLDASGSASLSATDLDDGSSDNCSIASIALSQTAFDCGHIGDNALTFTATDPSGNEKTAMVNVTVLDTTSPTPIAHDTTLYLDASGSASVTADGINDGSTDNCAIASISISQGTFDCTETGDHTITLTATDASGNVATTSAIVTVLDTTSPAPIVLNPTVYLDASGGVALTVDEVDNGSTDNCSIAARSLDVTSFDCSHVGLTNTVNLTIEDQSGNQTIASVTVTVLDTVSPVVIRRDTTLYLDDAGLASVTPELIDGGSTDNCGIGSLALAQESFGCGDTGTNQVLLTVTDLHGNVSSVMSSIEVLDTTSPTIVCPSDAQVTNDPGKHTATFTFDDPAFDDNCSASIALTEGLTSGSEFPLGMTTVTYQVTDASGNTADCSFTVEVLYVNEKPTFDLGSDPVLSLEDEGTTSRVGWANFIPTVEGTTNPVEAGQSAMQYTVSNVSNPALFSTQPTVASDGTLTYEAAPDANGSSTFDLIVQDNGGTANGGVDVSDIRTVTIEVTPVNDAPTIDDITSFQHYALETVEVPLTGLSTGAANEDQQIFISAASSDFAIPDPEVIYDSPSDTGILVIELSEYFSSPVTITVTVMDDGGTNDGGVDETEITFQLMPVDIGEDIAFVPTLFTPNGDGNNDVFVIHDNSFFSSISMEVYDREGNQVFSTTDVTLATETGWDGDSLPSGTYVYRISGVYKDGSILDEQVGQVRLSR